MFGARLKPGRDSTAFTRSYEQTALNYLLERSDISLGALKGRAVPYMARGKAHVMSVPEAWNARASEALGELPSPPFVTVHPSTSPGPLTSIAARPSSALAIRGRDTGLTNSGAPDSRTRLLHSPGFFLVLKLSGSSRPPCFQRPTLSPRYD